MVCWAFVAVGSNVEPERFIPEAMRRMRELGRLGAVSRMLENRAVGKLAQPDFVNGAVMLRCPASTSAIDLHTALHRIEDELGRIRGAGPRCIDLDLCLFGSTVLVTETFSLPHREILRFAHVAVPLAELAPDFIHPTTGEPLARIAQRLTELEPFAYAVRADIDAEIAPLVGPTID